MEHPHAAVAARVSADARARLSVSSEQSLFNCASMQLQKKQSPTDDPTSRLLPGYSHSRPVLPSVSESDSTLTTLGHT